MLLRPDMKHNEEVGEGERRVVVEAAAEKGELFVEFPRKHTKQNSLNVLTQLQIKWERFFLSFLVFYLFYWSRLLRYGCSTHTTHPRTAEFLLLNFLLDSGKMYNLNTQIGIFILCYSFIRVFITLHTKISWIRRKSASEFFLCFKS